MASTVTLATLRTMARRRADMENSSFVTDTELNEYINTAIKRLYDLLVMANEDYYTTSDTVTTDGTSKEFNLPADFYKIKGLDYNLNGTTRSMKPYPFNERNDFQNNTSEIRYRLRKDKIRFEPAPSAQSMTLWYVPAFSDLSNDADTFDGVNGWEELVAIDAAIKCKRKEESDTQELIFERERLYAEIKEIAKSRDQAFPQTVSDVTGWYTSEDDLA